MQACRRSPCAHVVRAVATWWRPVSTTRRCSDGRCLLPCSRGHRYVVGETTTTEEETKPKGKVVIDEEALQRKKSRKLHGKAKVTAVARMVSFMKRAGDDPGVRAFSDSDSMSGACPPTASFRVMPRDMNPVARL